MRIPSNRSERTAFRIQQPDDPMLERLTNILFILAIASILIAFVGGCSSTAETVAEPAAPSCPVAGSSASAPSQGTEHYWKEPTPPAFIFNEKTAPAQAFRDRPSPGQPAPALEIPGPELTNVNLYARKLEKKLHRRYNNTPKYAGNIAKVQLVPVGEPEVSLDGRKMRMEWSQVVFDSWGKRVPDLEKEYYVVTFGDGRPLTTRTRPSITVGLNNESGYSEFAPVRGGALSGVEKKSNPGMFDKATSEKTSPLEDQLQSKDSAPAPYREYELPEMGELPRVHAPEVPVLAPVADNLQAVPVLTRAEQ